VYYKYETLYSDVGHYKGFCYFLGNCVRQVLFSRGVFAICYNSCGVLCGVYLLVCHSITSVILCYIVPWCYLCYTMIHRCVSYGYIGVYHCNLFVCCCVNNMT
jgi:hypothetical protein